MVTGGVVSGLSGDVDAAIRLLNNGIVFGVFPDELTFPNTWVEGEVPNIGC
jgi:hypothetical protein